MTADVVEIQVNGKPRHVAEGTTVAALIVELGLGGKPIAVERNREVIPKARHATTLDMSKASAAVKAALS